MASRWLTFKQLTGASGMRSMTMMFWAGCEALLLLSARVVSAPAVPHHAVRLPDSNRGLRAALLDHFRKVVPSSAFRLVVTTLDEISSGAGGGKLSLAFSERCGRPPTVSRPSRIA